MSSVPQIPVSTTPNYYPQAYYTTATSTANPATSAATHYTPSATAAQYLAYYTNNASNPIPGSNPYGSYTNQSAYSFSSAAPSYGLGLAGIPGATSTAAMGTASNSTSGTGTHKNPTGTLRPSSPAAPAVTAHEASQVVQRLAVSELKNAGFSGAKPEALYVLEQEVVGFVQSLYTLAHEYSNLANRSGPIATDLLLATEELDRDWAYELGPEKLAKWLRRRERRKAKKDAKGKGKPTAEEKAYSSTPSLSPHPARSPTPELLQSDDDMDLDDVVPTASIPAPVQQTHQVSQIPPMAHPSHLSLAPPSLTLIPAATTPGTNTKLRTMPASTLRNLPGNLPGLPPKHTYLQTPATPRRTISQPSNSSSDPTPPKSQNQLQMEKKLRTAALVQESLKNLLLATEYTEDPEFDSGGMNVATARENAELLGHIVNWESTMGMAGGVGRKRWRV
ncbi:hypothetical protein J3R30DRAFT_3523975 [Lentinula aciculospora]|uniref:Transcription initiation factor TFIID subunit 8 n=1 Tax=Lentinula aciculospora TaxID=153920 RepID=A0A9W9DJL0_9AGAR|nr:hypothetical protein J3R30DRAFT_3523975 [Lentinula aciculospora]